MESGFAVGEAMMQGDRAERSTVMERRRDSDAVVDGDGVIVKPDLASNVVAWSGRRWRSRFC